ncbi:MAG: hypothetical protein K0A89_11325 [ANME-2 cluster archaeon]|nr:hypothetical protein [Methanosarcinales archaeon]MBW6519076.1 hypothetical protein [ANME-2 cluster archaeon]
MVAQELFNTGRLLVYIFFIICLYYFINRFYFKKELQKTKRTECFNYWFFYLKSVVLVFILYSFKLLLSYLSGSLSINEYRLTNLLYSYVFILILFGVIAILIKVFGYDRTENMYPQGIIGWGKLLIAVMIGIVTILFLIISSKNLGLS